MNTLLGEAVNIKTQFGSAQWESFGMRQRLMAVEMEAKDEVQQLTMNEQLLRKS